VIEPSLGVERLFLALLLDNLEDETLENGEVRTLLKINKELAPYQVNVLPLVKKYHTEKAEEVFEILLKDFVAFYDDAGNIGRRYRRADAIGTPYCVTIDNETFENNTVTVRDRDSMEQVRVKIEELTAYLKKEFL
ncbi:MAG: His/Gly/Thr/Pro-type tRNA ligase C-terminal domain-containing protein, partial [Candidatus Izemoplasmatales bacterium]